MTQLPRAVLFDLGHTLWDWRGDGAHLEATAAEVARRLQYSDEHHEFLRRALLTAGMRIAESYFREETHEVDFLAIIAREMTAMGEPWRPSDAALIARSVFDMEERVCAMPDYVPGLFDRLRDSGFRIGAVSNTPVPGFFMRNLLRSRGLLHHVEVLISSADFGLRKPHPAIYAAACRALHVPPARCVFVGDRVKEDVRGPRAAGMRGILTREHRSDEPHSDEPDAVVASLREIPEILERLIPAGSTRS